ncbi:heterogeneous nuclear ribonucleoprotein C-like [Antechinus flavipes]|uniref:heterogeneous nuclear ribonucleoprotein C-like n=1 Tax=Antechinus flavipes TaxID=38775 RepID=UPI002235B9AE|nr:heterogeneous nuclear ribonucleoprotein C-like [Antechinus flavipes]
MSPGPKPRGGRPPPRAAEVGRLVSPPRAAALPRARRGHGTFQWPRAQPRRGGFGGGGEDAAAAAAAAEDEGLGLGPVSRGRGRSSEPRAAPPPPRATATAGSSSGGGGFAPRWHPAGPPRAGMTLFGSEEACRRYLDMARDPKGSRARPGQKRQHSATLYHSNCDLNYELYREDFPYRVYEYQRIPPLINRAPVKSRRTHMGTGGKSGLNPHIPPRSNNPPPVRTKLRAEELHSIKGELSQIKAQVDSLLESLERMDQRRDRLGGPQDSEKKAASAGGESSSAAPEAQREPRGKESPEARARSRREADSAEESTDTEEAVRMKNHTSDPDGSQ